MSASKFAHDAPPDKHSRAASRALANALCKQFTSDPKETHHPTLVTLQFHFLDGNNGTCGHSRLETLLVWSGVSRRTRSTNFPSTLGSLHAGPLCRWSILTQNLDPPVRKFESTSSFAQHRQTTAQEDAKDDTANRTIVACVGGRTCRTRTRQCTPCLNLHRFLSWPRMKNHN